MFDVILQMIVFREIFGSEIKYKMKTIICPTCFNVLCLLATAGMAELYHATYANV